MIDTIRLSYLANSKLAKIVSERSDKLVKVSSNGEVLWQKGYMKDDLPSHFSGLRIAHIEQKALLQQGFKNARDLIQFEFSLQKWQSETGYNNCNTPLDKDLLVLRDWVDAISEELEYSFDFDLFEIYRVDIAQNYILEGSTSVNEYLKALQIRFSRHEKSERHQTYDGAVFYGSSWISKKMYWKHKEFQDIERKKKPHAYRIKEEGVGAWNFKKFGVLKKHSEKESCEAGIIAGGGEVKLFHDGKRALNQSEIDEMLRMVRFELGYKRTYLDRHKIIRIKDIPQLLEHYSEEKKRYLTVQKLGPGLRLSNGEYVVIDLVKRYGVEGGKSEFLKQKTSRTWERVKSSLVSKGVYLECILKDDFQQDIEEADKIAHFELRLAA